MNAQEFFTKYDGKIIDFDGVYGGQCVDLYRRYVKEVLGFTQSPPVVGAADIWDTYLKDRFDRIENTPTGVPQLGDILIWNKNAGGGFGHVGVFSEGTANSFRSFDQNWPSGSPCHIQGHYYTNVLGWLRPQTMNSDLKECLKLHDELVTQNINLKDTLEGVQTEFAHLKGDSASQIRIAQDGEKQQREKYEIILSTVAGKLQTTQDTARIYPEIDRLIGIEDALNQERKAHDSTRDQLTEANAVNQRLKAEIDQLKVERLQAMNLGDVSLADFITAKIKKYKEMLRR